MEDWSALMIEMHRIQKDLYEVLNKLSAGHGGYWAQSTAREMSLDLLSLAGRLHERVHQMDQLEGA